MPEFHQAASLTFAEQVELLSELIPLAESQDHLCAELRKQGFESFGLRQKFNESFCRGCDREVSKTYQIEEAKVKFASPDGLPGFLIGNERGYTSPILSRMRKERDQGNGVSYQNIPGSAGWKRYIDPCIRELEKERCEDPESFAAKHRKWEHEVDLARMREIALIKCSPRALPSSASNLTETFRFSFQERFFDLGFSADLARSKSGRMVISKSMTTEWDLCFTSESKDDFPPLTVVTAEGAVTTYLLCLRLYLCSKRAIKFEPIPINFQRHPFMTIRYDLLIPEFAGAYSSFSDDAELNVIVAAHAILYGLIAEFCETRIRKYLNRRSK